MKADPILCAATACAALLGACAPASRGPAVFAAVETIPVASAGDAADDPAVWADRRDPSRVLVLGTDKREKGGIGIYGLDGIRRGWFPLPLSNNVDLRDGFVFAPGDTGVLVVVSVRMDSTMALLRLRTDSVPRLEDVAAAKVRDGEPYGVCVGAGPAGWAGYVVRKDGAVVEWLLAPTGDGKVGATRGRRWDMGTQGEGCVSDDIAQRLFVGEEDRGLWAFDRRTGIQVGAKIDSVAKGRPLRDDVEGVTLWEGHDGAGYLVVSSQGDHAFAVYDRIAPHAYRGKFHVAPGARVDGTEETDGLAATSLASGTFPRGFLAIQDGENDNGLQNFKLVDWREVERALSLDSTLSPAR